MTVGTAQVLLQIGDTPVIFGCAESVAKRLCRATAGGPPCVAEIKGPGGSKFVLTDYGREVKKALGRWICLSAK